MSSVSTMFALSLISLPTRHLLQDLILSHWLVFLPGEIVECVQLMIGHVCCCAVRSIHLDVNILHKLKKTKANMISAVYTHISAEKGKTSVTFFQNMLGI